MSYGELTLPPVWTGINKQNMDGDGRAPCIIAVPRLAGDSKGVISNPSARVIK